MTDANALERHLWSLAPDDIQNGLGRGILPSTAQCAGSGRLLGTAGGQAICEVCGIRSDDAARALSTLAVCLRAYIVLDDFLKDNRVEDRVASATWTWLSSLQEEVFRVVTYLGDDPAPLWYEHLATHEDAFASFDSDRPYRSALRKCFLMFIPFEMKILKESPSGAVFRTYVEHYLFSLQLLDDFHDMEEDARAPRNQNLFLVSASDEHHARIMSFRPLIICSLLSYIRQDLQGLRGLNSRTVLGSFENSLEWLAHAEKRTKGLPIVELFKDPYEAFRFDDTAVGVVESAAEKNWQGVFRPVKLDFVRAENMHTLLR